MKSRIRRAAWAWFFYAVTLLGAGVMTLPEGFTAQHFTGLVGRALAYALIVAAVGLFVHQKAKL